VYLRALVKKPRSRAKLKSDKPLFRNLHLLKIQIHTGFEDAKNLDNTYLYSLFFMQPFLEHMPNFQNLFCHTSLEVFFCCRPLEAFAIKTSCIPQFQKLHIFQKKSSANLNIQIKIVLEMHMIGIHFLPSMSCLIP
jgi:hypothetical protein